MAGQQLPIPEPMQCTGDVATLPGSLRSLRHGYGAGKEREGSTSSHSKDSNKKGMSANIRATGTE